MKGINAHAVCVGLPPLNVIHHLQKSIKNVRTREASGRWFIYKPCRLELVVSFVEADNGFYTFAENI